MAGFVAADGRSSEVVVDHRDSSAGEVGGPSPVAGAGGGLRIDLSMPGDARQRPLLGFDAHLAGPLLRDPAGRGQDLSPWTYFFRGPVPPDRFPRARLPHVAEEHVVGRHWFNARRRGRNPLRPLRSLDGNEESHGLERDATPPPGGIDPVGHLTVAIPREARDHASELPVSLNRPDCVLAVGSHTLVVGGSRRALSPHHDHPSRGGTWSR